MGRVVGLEIGLSVVGIGVGCNTGLAVVGGGVGERTGLPVGTIDDVYRSILLAVKKQI